MPKKRTAMRLTCTICDKPFEWIKQYNRPQARTCSNPCRVALLQSPASYDPIAFSARLRTEANGCLVWTGKILKSGYGQLNRNRKAVTTHRLAWEFAYGPIPDGLWVLHKCDNPPCCNPEHLFLGTQVDNMRDMAEKGRWTPRIIARRHIGEQCSYAKLSEEQVIESRSRHAKGSVSINRLADEFKVSYRTMWDVIRRRSWTHVE